MTAMSLSESHQLVDEWLRQIGAQAGFPLRLDAEGVGAVGHRSGLDCAIEVDAVRRMVFLTVPLMPWPMEAPDRVAARCLQGHFLGVDTAGGSFAIDDQTRELVLWKSLPLERFDAQTFGEALASFLDVAQAWRDDLSLPESAHSAPEHCLPAVGLVTPLVSGLV